MLRRQLPAEDVSLPLRHLRVVYALPDDDGPPSLYATVGIGERPAGAKVMTLVSATYDRFPRRRRRLTAGAAGGPGA